MRIPADSYPSGRWAGTIPPVTCYGAVPLRLFIRYWLAKRRGQRALKRVRRHG